MKNILRISASLLFFFTAACVAENSGAIALDLQKAKKIEVTDGMGGPRNTLLFYTFEKEKIVVEISINNKDKSFPVNANVYVFNRNVSDEGLKNWLNNQHSDGLMPNVPKPEKNIVIPAKNFKVVSANFKENKKSHFGMFAKYAVKLKMNAFTDKKSVNLKGADIDTNVYVKVK